MDFYSWEKPGKDDGTLKGPINNQLHNVLIKYYAEEVTARWAYLRQDILTMDNVTRHFQDFFADIPEAVYQAEFAKWPDVPNQEINRNNIYSSAEEQLAKMDAFFYNFKNYV